MKEVCKWPNVLSR